MHLRRVAVAQKETGDRGQRTAGGEDEYIVIDGYKGIIGTRPRTVAAWIKTERDDGRILCWGREDGGEMFIFGFIRGRVGITPKGGYLYMNAKTSDNQAPRGGGGGRG